MTENAYENARRLTIREISPELAGFRADTEEKTGHLDHFKNGWIGKKPGDKVTFETEGSCIAVQYRKTIHKPALQLQSLCWTGTEPMRYFLMQISMKTGVTACIWNQSFIHGENKTHRVEIEILPE